MRRGVQQAQRVAKLEAEVARLRRCIYETHGLAVLVEDIDFMEIGTRPDGTWCAWDLEYPEEGALSLGAPVSGGGGSETP